MSLPSARGRAAECNAGDVGGHVGEADATGAGIVDGARAGDHQRAGGVIVLRKNATVAGGIDIEVREGDRPVGVEHLDGTCTRARAGDLQIRVVDG